MITNMILKGEQNKVCVKKIIFKIPLINFLPIAKKKHSGNFSTYKDFGHLNLSFKHILRFLSQLSLPRGGICYLIDCFCN